MPSSEQSIFCRLTVREFWVHAELATKFELDQRNGKGSEADVEFFRTLYPRLKVWFNWFNTTQIG